MATRLVILLCFSAFGLDAQNILFTASSGVNQPRYLWQINLTTCEWCPVLPFPVGSHPILLPNGNIAINNAGGTVSIYDPSSSALITTVPGVWACQPFLHTDGVYYVSTGPALASFNPDTYATTIIGNFPSNIYISALFNQGSTLYGYGYDYNNPQNAPIFSINPINPPQLTQVIAYANYIASITTASNGQLISNWFGGGIYSEADFNAYDLNTNTWTNICQTPLTLLSNFSPLPSSANLACVCLPSSAGTPTTSTASICEPNTYTSIFNNNAQPNVGDGISYILYSNPSDATGSVLFQNNTGVFPYLPPLQPNITYYVARITGDTLNGMVTITDPCLAISPAIEVTWKSKPQLVSLSSNSNDLCVGSCQSINLVLQGTPPFAYGWQWQQNGQQVGFTQAQFGQQTNNITLQACAPPGASGTLTFVLCGITDAFCSNQP